MRNNFIHEKDNLVPNIRSIADETTTNNIMDFFLLIIALGKIKLVKL